MRHRQERTNITQALQLPCQSLQHETAELCDLRPVGHAPTNTDGSSLVAKSRIIRRRTPPCILLPPKVISCLSKPCRICKKLLQRLCFERRSTPRGELPQPPVLGDSSGSQAGRAVHFQPKTPRPVGGRLSLPYRLSSHITFFSQTSCLVTHRVHPLQAPSSSNSFLILDGSR